ncbi:MAG: nucleoside hydrolase [Armatimonadota bacterium]
MTDRIPILLDTDPGNDIDDAVAISYLLKQPRCELLGITTVSGPVAQRAAIAEVLCKSVGRDDVPIVAGRSAVLTYGQGQPWCSQYSPIEHLPHSLDYPEDAAVDFLRQQIRSRPGEITLISIGPFMNLALLFAIDPEIPFLLKGLYTMAGKFFISNEPEWNCLIDPVATSIVVKASRPDHCWFGLDVTTQCTMSPEEVESRFIGQPLETVVPMAQDWFSHTKKMVFHDPLAVATIFQPDICKFKRGRVHCDARTGATYFTEGEGNDLVASGVNVVAFFDEYFSVTAS